VFRVDLRLRAEGSVGRLARPLASYVDYYRTRGQTWERLALLKAWPIAGDLALGHAFLKAVRPFALGLKGGVGGGQTKAILEQVRVVKEMIDDKMAQRGHERRNVKLGTGGIRELEFVVQAIQVLSGNRLPGIVNRSTVGSLSRFRVQGLLSGPEHDRLVRAYLFLRDVEHKLQMVHDLQTHALPDTAEELTRCAIRLGYEAGDPVAAMKRFAADYRHHTELVNRVFRSVFYGKGRSPLLKAALIKTKRPGRK
jgi:glutamate-ammonia-ligase adenylyltransferase